MNDAFVIAGVLLVAAPVLGLIPVAFPPFFTVWSAPRERHIEIIAAHRRAWAWLNAGFTVATIGTAAGLVALAVALLPDPRLGAMVAALALAYAIAGALWCAMLAIRTWTTPGLHDLGATSGPPGDAERLLGMATGGLFASFILAASVILVALGVVLAVSGTVALAVAVIVVLIGAVALGAQLLTGDTVPALLYLPTLLVGIALLAGWT